MDFEYVLKVELMGVFNGLNVNYSREGSRSYLVDVWPEQLKNRVAIS